MRKYIKYICMLCLLSETSNTLELTSTVYLSDGKVSDLSVIQLDLRAVAM